MHLWVGVVTHTLVEESDKYKDTAELHTRWVISLLLLLSRDFRSRKSLVRDRFESTVLTVIQLRTMFP